MDELLTLFPYHPNIILTLLSFSLKDALEYHCAESDPFPNLEEFIVDCSWLTIFSKDPFSEEATNVGTYSTKFGLALGLKHLKQPACIGEMAQKRGKRVSEEFEPWLEEYHHP
jgi:hypothetical protein